jgi:hypothetical protein
MGKRVLFAVGYWGLGHATRDLPLIHGLLDAGHDVMVAADGPPLELLRRELAGMCEVIRLAGAPLPLASTTLRFYARYTLLLPRLWLSLCAQHAEVERLVRKRGVDLVVSDNRYGCFSWAVPSYLLVHGVRFIAPFGRWWLEPALEYFNYRAFAPFTRVIVPDYVAPALSVALSHDLRLLQPERLAYIGHLSSLQRRAIMEDLDYFVTISGPEPQRGLLERALLAQVPALPGRGVLALGRPGACAVEQRGGFRVYSYLDRAAQEEIMNRARVVVSRSGYSTLMELAELSKCALLIPTPGQTEQEYLGAYHQAQGNAPMVTQGALSLSRDLARVGAGFRGLHAPRPTRQSVAAFLALVVGQPTAESAAEVPQGEAPPNLAALPG